MKTRAVPGAGVVLALVATAALQLHGAGRQQPAPAQTPAQTFRASTVVVQVDAIVTDGKGHFVADLTPADFEVLEDGTPQSIQAVYRVEGTTVSPVEAPSAQPEVQPSATMTPPRADQRVSVFFFDQEHLTQGSFTRLRQAAEEYLKTGFRQGDVGGVLMGSTMAGNRLTTDRDELMRDLESVKISQGLTMLRRDLQDWPRMSALEALRIALQSDQNLLEQVVDRAKREAPGGERGLAGEVDYTPTVMSKARTIASTLREGTGKTLATLAALAGGLARIPGRKTIVMLSEGFYVDEALAQLRQIVATAARSNVRIYAIDGRGLDRTPEGSDLSAIGPLETGNSASTAAYDSIGDGTSTLAVDTGGFVVRNTNAFTTALADIAEDTSHYYVIGYSASNPAMDGKFRQIAVRVKRPGVKVRARKGYLATADAVPAATMVAAPAPAPAPAPAEPTTAPASAASALPAPEAPVAPAVPTSAAPAGAVPASAPATAPAAPASAGGGVPGITLRPDAEERVRELAGRAGESGEAKRLASKGWDRYGQGDLEGAESLLAQAAALPGTATWVSYALGFAELGLGKPKAAVQSWERVRAEVPQFQSVYFDLADGYTQLNDPGRAVAVLRLAESRWPKDAEVLNALGTVHVRRGALDDALETFQKAADSQPDDALAYFNLGRTYELRYYKMRRFSDAMARWLDNPADLSKAIENYQAYLKIGGPYADDARAAIERLKWVGAIK